MNLFPQTTIALRDLNFSCGNYTKQTNWYAIEIRRKIVLSNQKKKMFLRYTFVNAPTFAL